MEYRRYKRIESKERLLPTRLPTLVYFARRWGAALFVTSRIWNIAVLYFRKCNTVVKTVMCEFLCDMWWCLWEEW